MKAVLVVDMPNNCEECKIIYLQGHGESSICDSGDWSKRPSWCPLKPLPRKLDYHDLRWCNQDNIEGWNACIDTITGETE